MRTALTFLLLASSVFAQSKAPSSPSSTSCGPTQVEFDVKLDRTRHALGQAEPGKALVYVIEVFQRPLTELGVPTIRVGLDGAWVGANHGTSFLSFSVEPGEHHLCTNWQSVLKRLSDQHSLTSFTAEAGKTYFFRVQVYEESAGGKGQFWTIDLQPVDADEGNYLLTSAPLSSSKPKK